MPGCFDASPILMLQSSVKLCMLLNGASESAQCAQGGDTSRVLLPEGLGSDPETTSAVIEITFTFSRRIVHKHTEVAWTLYEDMIRHMVLSFPIVLAHCKPYGANESVSLNRCDYTEIGIAFPLPWTTKIRALLEEAALNNVREDVYDSQYPPQSFTTNQETTAQLHQRLKGYDPKVLKFSFICEPLAALCSFLVR